MKYRCKTCKKLHDEMPVICGAKVGYKELCGSLEFERIEEFEMTREENVYINERIGEHG